MAKKILIDARMYGLENSGIGRYLMNLIEELQQIDSENTYTILLRKKYFDELNLKSNWKKLLADFRHYGFDEQIKLPGLIKKENPDLVHFPHLNIPMFWNGNFIVTIHDLTMQKQSVDATTLPLPLYYLKRLPFLLISKKAAKQSLKIIVPSQSVKKDLSNYYKVENNKTDVIYEGITNIKLNGYKEDPKITLSKYKIKGPYFIYVGNAYPHKNLKRAMEAIVELNKKSKELIQLVIGGSRNVFTKRLDEETKELNAEKYIKLIGFVEDNDLAILYQNSQAFIYPSLSEGYGLQGLEAIAAGTVVLASNISVFKEVYSSNALYFNPTNPVSISDTMRNVLEFNKEERKNFINNSQKFIKKYSWSKMAKETLGVYNSMLNI